MNTILSLDGGGVRGIMPAVVLAEINDLAGRPLTELFHYQIASSTGGIIQGASNLPDKPFSYKDIVQLYKDKAQDIFNRTIWSKITNPEGLFKPKYPETGIDALFKKEFGDVTLSQLRSKHIHFTSYDLQKEAFVTLNSKDNPKMLLRDTVREATAAPYYFKEKSGHIDGGVGANNPSGVGYSIAVKEGASNRNTFVLSVGTGKVKTGINLGDGGLLGVLPKLPRLYTEVEMGAADLMMINFLGKNYFRIEFSLTDEQDSLDNASSDNLNTLEKIAETYIDNHKDDLTRLVKKLVGKK